MYVAGVSLLEQTVSGERGTITKEFLAKSFLKIV